jgi:hypothetical protein
MFNAEKFKTVDFERRTASVPVPALSAFFPEDTPPEDRTITVQCLTGTEVGRANERVKTNKNLSALVEKVISERISTKVDGTIEAFGIAKRDDPTDDTVRRIAVLEYGLVDFELDQAACVKFNNAYPVEFRKLTDKIFELTGLGMVPLGE